MCVGAYVCDVSQFVSHIFVALSIASSNEKPCSEAKPTPVLNISSFNRYGLNNPNIYFNVVNFYTLKMFDLEVVEPLAVYLSGFCAWTVWWEIYKLALCMDDPPSALQKFEFRPSIS